jgi:hypothetical protein
LTGTGGGGFRVTVDPDPGQVAKDLRKISREMGRTVGRLHRELSGVPVQEIRKRARSAPRGQVRIGRAVKPSATAKEVVVLGGRGYPDFGGQVWGSKQYKRFAPYTGGPYEDTYVIGPILRDEAFMEEFGGKYVEGFTELLETVWSGK